MGKRPLYGIVPSQGECLVDQEGPPENDQFLMLSHGNTATGCSTDKDFRQRHLCQELSLLSLQRYSGVNCSTSLINTFVNYQCLSITLGQLCVSLFGVIIRFRTLYYESRVFQYCMRAKMVCLVGKHGKLGQHSVKMGYDQYHRHLWRDILLGSSG